MTRRTTQILLLLLALCALSAVFADTLYKWVDDQGNVHYSDKPQPGATKVHLPKPTTYSPPTVDVSTPPPSAHPQPITGYTSFEIGSPTPDQVFWNVQSITVTLSAQPGLHQGDQVSITLDDKTVGPAESMTASFDNLDRGEHTVHATLTETDGSTMVAKPVTFYIQKGTVKGLKKVH